MADWSLVCVNVTGRLTTVCVNVTGLLTTPPQPETQPMPIEVAHWQELILCGRRVQLPHARIAARRIAALLPIAFAAPAITLLMDGNVLHRMHRLCNSGADEQPTLFERQQRLPHNRPPAQASSGEQRRQPTWRRLQVGSEQLRSNDDRPVMPADRRLKCASGLRGLQR